MADLNQQATALAASGNLDAAMALLAAANSERENGHFQSRLLQMRHRKFVEATPPEPAQPWPQPVRDLFPGATGIPEIPAARLTAELVHSAIQHHGSLIVRQWFDAPTCAFMRETIDQSFAAAAAVQGQESFEPSPWFRHFTPVSNRGFRLGGFIRDFTAAGAGVLAVDSPRAMCRYLDRLYAMGIDDLLTEYFGERPAFSALKTALRRTPADVPAEWHQDGSYFGQDIRSLNIWAAFSPCGVDAPSLDIVARRMDRILRPDGTDIPSLAVTEEAINSLGEEQVVRPVLAAGDVVLLDDRTLHRTGASPSMTESRYAIEMWFFASSLFPQDQIPLYL